MLKRTPAPPMGWNSYDVYLGSVTEEQYRAAVDYIAEHLNPSGYEYCVMDAGWYSCDARADPPTPEDPTPFYRMDRYGRPLPHPRMFPSAVGDHGFKPLCDYVHQKGLKLGLHMMRGMHKNMTGRGFTVKGTEYPIDEVIDYSSPCPWGDDPVNFGVKPSHPAAQAYYDSLFALFAQWGVDFVKYDDMVDYDDEDPIHKEEFLMIERAIEKCGREIVLSISPGNHAKFKDAAFYSGHATMWRITGDLWDSWADLKKAFIALPMWNSRIEDGGWPDPDMMPLGHICEVPSSRGITPRLSRLNPDEMRSEMTLFAIARAPLILGCNFEKTNDLLLSIQTQPDCIAVNQRGEGNRVIFNSEHKQVWRARADGVDYLALFYIGDEERRSCFSIPRDLRGKTAADVWTGESFGKLDGMLTLPITAHGCRLLRLR